jgi:hypothetical protein
MTIAVHRRTAVAVIVAAVVPLFGVATLIAAFYVNSRVNDVVDDITRDTIGTAELIDSRVTVSPG